MACKSLQRTRCTHLPQRMRTAQPRSVRRRPCRALAGIHPHGTECSTRRVATGGLKGTNRAWATLSATELSPGLAAAGTVWEINAACGAVGDSTKTIDTFAAKVQPNGKLAVSRHDDGDLVCTAAQVFDRCRLLATAHRRGKSGGEESEVGLARQRMVYGSSIDVARSESDAPTLTSDGVILDHRLGTFHALPSLRNTAPDDKIRRRLHS
eukprot:7384218-Prymnesium_polylepis.3